MQKLYCYADETGQDTAGVFYLVAVDGLNEKERQRVTKEVRAQRIILRRAVRGLRYESNATIRLADALAGLVRDSLEGAAYAQKLVQRLTPRHILSSA